MFIFRRKIEDEKLSVDSKDIVRISPILKKRLIFSFEPVTKEKFKQKAKELR